MPEQINPDQIADELYLLHAAVDDFAACMKAKLTSMARDESRTGWNDPANAEAYYEKLMNQAAGVLLAAGQEIDIANFAMFLHYQRTAKPIGSQT